MLAGRTAYVVDGLLRERCAGPQPLSHLPMRSPPSGLYRGHEHVRRYVEDWRSTFDNVWLELGEPSAVGDHVVVVVRGHGRGRASGVELYSSFCQVWTLRRGKAVRMDEFPTRDQGLAALR